MTGGLHHGSPAPTEGTHHGARTPFALFPGRWRLELALDALLAELRKRHGSGRNDFPVAAMWRAVIAGILFQHASVESLLRELNRNPALLDLCRFNPLPVRRWGEGRCIADTAPNSWNGLAVPEDAGG
ncbi:MAG: transposase [Boseongicola sp. SB0677_bin_26]|nr:transposase [Boseongicola sp. SB0665_bin_10]MYG25270.1 transposase [Boseongicola sp. SB0677_bin_26]